MIYLYTGTPGSGKSFHASSEIFYGLRSGNTYICNFPINLQVVKKKYLDYIVEGITKKERPSTKKIGTFIFKNNHDLTVEYLMEYAKNNHSFKKESETTVVIDECGIIFNPRMWDNKERMKWIQFFSMHRHYGFDIILISQTDRMIDRQIRGFVEYEIKHRKVGNFKLIGKLLSKIVGGTLFVCITYWYGIREKVGSKFVKYESRIAKIYDTFGICFDNENDTNESHKGESISVQVGE